MDCLLCPQSVPIAQLASPVTQLLGMPVCGTCIRRYLCGPGGSWLEKVPTDVWNWAILVARMVREHELERYVLRVATRLAHAKLAGLEADPADFVCWPTLEVDVHGFTLTQPVGM